MTSLSISSKVSGSNSRSMRSRAVSLPAARWRCEALFAAAEFSPPFAARRGCVCPSRAHRDLAAACDFSQSLRKFARPMSVSGCLKS